MLERRKVITIDGLAATGKSSVAQSLAKRLDYAHFSSGLLYRLLGYAVLSHASNIKDETTVMSCLQSLKLEIELGKERNNIAMLNGKDITNQLFSSNVSEASSRVSVFPGVRKFLLEKQRNIFSEKNLVAEGRDMGTVVFPNADLKFFIEAELGVRIKRRLSQINYDQEGADVELNSLKQNMEVEIIERDRRDIERENSPTIPAIDSIRINNSKESLTEVVERMYDFVSKRGLVI